MSDFVGTSSSEISALIEQHTRLLTEDDSTKVVVYDASGSTGSESRRTREQLHENILINDDIINGRPYWKTISAAQTNEIMSIVQNGETFDIFYFGSVNRLMTRGFIKETHVFDPIVTPFLIAGTAMNYIPESSTKPHFALEQIKDSYLATGKRLSIYVICDGQIDSDSIRGFTSEIKRIISLYKTQVKFHFIAISVGEIDISSEQAMRRAPGSDQFRILQENGLTQNVASYTIKTEKGDAVLFSSTSTCPTGYFPFGKERMMLNTDFSHFLAIISQQVQSSSSDRVELIKLAQNIIVNALKFYLSDKTPRMKTEIIRLISNFFRNTVLEDVVINRNFIQQMLDNMLSGSANTITDTLNRKDMMAAANERNKDNLAQSVGIQSEFCAYPIFDLAGKRIILITGNASYVTFPFSNNGKTFNNAGFQIQGITGTIPALPMNSTSDEQALRQWVRPIQNSLFGTDVQSDIHIWIMFLIYCIVSYYSSHESAEYVSSMRFILTTILHKVRNSNYKKTELEWGQEGNMMHPNMGSEKDLEPYLRTAIELFPFMCCDIHPFTVMYWMFLSYADITLISNQLKFCEKSVLEDIQRITGTPFILRNSDGILRNTELKSVLGALILPSSMSIIRYNMEEKKEGGYDPIELDENVHDGWKQPDHFFRGYPCNPNFLFRESTYNDIRSRGSYRCFICQTSLNTEFTHVIIASNATIAVEPSVANPFIERRAESSYQRHVPVAAPAAAGGGRSYAPVASASASAPASAPASASTQDNHLIVLHGGTGVGKSTTTGIMKSKLELNGQAVLIMSADQWSKVGKNPMNEINNAFKNFMRSKNPKKVIIMDLCNESEEIPSRPFKIDLSSWKAHSFWPNLDKSTLTSVIFRQYEEFALSNVLNRAKSDITTTYWLNRHEVNFKGVRGVRAVIQIHNMKFYSIHQLLRTGFSRQNIRETDSFDEIMSQITPGATAYRNYLATRNLDSDIKEFLENSRIIERSISPPLPVVVAPVIRQVIATAPQEEFDASDSFSLMGL